MNEYAEWDDNLLRSAMEAQQESVENYMAKVNEINEQIAAKQTELDRRALAAYWQANPGLQLAVGDKLLVTEGYARWIKLGYEAGNVVEIERIQRVGDEVQIWIPSAIGFGTYFIPLEHARQCRAAWLATQEVAE